MHGLAGTRHGQRWNQLQVKTLDREKVSERPVIVAGGFKADTHWLLEAMQVISQAPELDGSVQQDQALAALRAGRLNQYFVTKLGNIDGYQNGG